MKQKKDVMWNFKATEEFVGRLMRAAAVTDRPASQIAREAINEKLNELAQRYPEINAPFTEAAPVEEQAVAA